MKILLISVLCMYSFFVKAQIVEGVDISKQPGIIYIRLTISPYPSSKDFVGTIEWWPDLGTKNPKGITNEQGETIMFPTDMAVLNHVAAAGWRVIEHSNNPPLIYYLMERKE